MTQDNNASLYNGGSQDSPKSGLLTAHEVSQMLRIPLSTVYHLTQTGKLQAIRIGKHWRYHKQEVERLLFGENIAGADTGIHPSTIIPAKAGVSGEIPHQVRDDKKDESTPTHNKHSHNSSQKRKTARLNTHLPCQFEILIPGWKKIQGAAAIRKISVEGVYLRKIEILQDLQLIEPDDPIVLWFDLVGEISGRVVRLDKDPVQGGQNGPLGVAIAFRRLDEKMKKKIREFIG